MTKSQAPASTSGRHIYETSLVWDNVWPVDLRGGPSFGNNWERLDRFARAGVGVLGVTLAGDNHNISQGIQLVGWARAELERRRPSCVLIQSVQDIHAARANRSIGIILQFEGTRCFERNLEMIDVYYALGVRQTLLAFNNANSVGGGCAEENDRGLTQFGRRCIRELQRVGWLVDLSHTGYRTSMEALAVAERPMVFSHSNANAVSSSFRNICDDQVKACATTGGLVGVSGASSYVGDLQCRTESLFRHLDHFVQLVGPEHVGIGMDVVFDAKALTKWIRGRPDEWPIARDPAWPGFTYAMPEQLPEIADHMASAGYSETAIRGILGGNYLRICNAAWHGNK